MLEAISSIFSFNIVYIWKNKYTNRSYPLHIKCMSVKIILDEVNTKDDTEFLKSFFAEISEENKIFYANNIFPTFNLSFVSEVPPLGLHIRGTDRIGKRHPHFMKSDFELLKYINSSIHFVNKYKPKYLFICSDHESYKDLILKNISKEVTVLFPSSQGEVPQEYIDFFALTKCSGILMASKFSTFTFMASLVGRVKTFLFRIDQETFSRYPYRVF